MSGLVPTPKTHTLVKCHMRIIHRGDGIARFIKDPATDELPPRELVSSSFEFRNNHFRSYLSGQVVLCTFRLSPNGRRYLLNCRSTDGAAGGTPIEPFTESTITPVAPLAVEDGYYYPPDARRVFTIADKLAREDGMFALLMVGPSGYGKTTIPMRFAEKTGRKFVRINCASIRDPEEWFGFREARDGSTVFEPTEFAETVQAGGAVVVLDEVNRIEPWLHNTLFPMLDFSRKTRVHNTDFKIGDNTVIVMTINRGLEYSGTFEMDQAFLNRVNATVHVGPPPEEDEVAILMQRVAGMGKRDAQRIISVATSLRLVVEKGEIYVDCSTRAVLKIAQIFRAGLSMRECFHDVVEAVALREEDRKKIADILNTRLETMPTTIRADVFSPPVAET